MNLDIQQKEIPIGFLELERGAIINHGDYYAARRDSANNIIWSPYTAIIGQTYYPGSMSAIRPINPGVKPPNIFEEKTYSYPPVIIKPDAKTRVAKYLNKK